MSTGARNSIVIDVLWRKELYAVVRSGREGDSVLDILGLGAGGCSCSDGERWLGA
jgi:hypothetical protein